MIFYKLALRECLMPIKVRVLQHFLSASSNIDFDPQHQIVLSAGCCTILKAATSYRRKLICINSIVVLISYDSEMTVTHELAPTLKCFFPIDYRLI
jgi:hypothetical protein